MLIYIITGFVTTGVQIKGGGYYLVNKRGNNWSYLGESEQTVSISGTNKVILLINIRKNFPKRGNFYTFFSRI